ncbi:MAG: YraN family protein [Candidatus Obscuribacterales bacterium]|nr:YraN family protein [Candidatus Obscuribacterales bacterium]
MPDSIKTRIAKGGEDAAVAFLEKQGYEILDRNWRSGRFGEIDIIARDRKGLLVFVEVKTRKVGNDFGIPESGFTAVDWRKQRKITFTATSYLAKKRLVERARRFDAIIVSFVSLETIAQAQIIHVTEAFH